MKNQINVLVDWGKSFVDKNGSFYCGTTLEQKENAVRILKASNGLVIYCGDVHPKTSSEFIKNGGLYPAHNLILKDQKNVGSLGVKSDQTTSPQLTDCLYNLVKDKTSGLIIPRHVFFQDYDQGQTAKPCFSLQDIEETFSIKKLNTQEFLEGKIDYVINVKHLFNSTALKSTNWLGHFDGIPDQETNIFSLLEQKYGQGKDLEFNIDGVVMGICIYQTASGIKQIFPKSKVNIIADASTHLIYEQLGIPDEEIGNFVVQRMCKQVGIEYITTLEYLKRNL
jgi:hypothetical protein